MQVNVDPGFDADMELAQRALKRGWVTRERIESAILAQERTPGSRLLNHLPLTPDQLQKLMAPEGQMPPEIAAVAQEPSRRLDHYILGDFLHSGGMGRVHKAWDLKLSRWVALKCLKAVGDERSEAYFDREARLAAGLSHPNIAAIYESGRAGGESFIAMQLIPGKTLDKWGRRDVPRLVSWVRDAARAVAYANSKGIVHRDLKPTNVMVTPEGQVFVLDFGLARPVAVKASHSATGKAMGTPAYMSPEQARGGPVDARSDVYSLGATLFECLTGRAPFSGTTIYDVLRKVEETAPARPRRLNPRIAPDLETIILKCLEKEASRRYRSADELADDLDRYLNHDPIQARPAGVFYRMRRTVAKRKAIALASVVTVVLAGVLGWWFAIGRPHSEQLTVGTEHMRRRESAMKLWAEARGLAMAGVDPDGIKRRAKAAREAFERAIEIGEDAPSLVMRGRCLLLEARDAEALKALERAHQVEPSSEEARLELAKALISKYSVSRGTPVPAVSTSESGDETIFYVGSLPPETVEQLGWRERAVKLLALQNVTPVQRNLLRGILAMGKGEYRHAAESFGTYAKAERWDVEALMLEAKCRYLDADFPGAVAAMDMALDRVPGAGAFGFRGMAKSACGNHDGAIVDHSKAIELNPKDPKSYCDRGDAKRAKGLLGEAIEDYSKAIELNPSQPIAYMNRGSAKSASRLYDKAIVDYTEAIRRDPKYALAYMARGYAKFAKGQCEEALADYSKSIELDPKYAPTYSNRGLAKHSLGFHQEAISDHSKAIDLDPSFASAYTNRGNVWLALGRYEEAVKDHSRAIELNPKMASAYSNRASARLNLGHLDEAIADCTKALGLEPGLVDAYHNRADGKRLKGLMDEALADITKAIEIDPKDAMAYHKRGIMSATNGKQDEALADWTKAIDLDPKYVLAYLNRGRVREAMGLFDEALADFQKVLEVAPTGSPHRSSAREHIVNREATLAFQKGNRLHDAKKYREAITEFRAIVESHPESRTAISAAYNIACGYSLLGEKANALEWLEKAFDIGWKDVEHLEKDPDLDSLRQEDGYKRLLARLKGE